MRIGIYEYLTACESEGTSGAIWHEGFAMLRALVLDTLAAGLEVDVAWRIEDLQIARRLLPSHEHLRLVGIRSDSPEAERRQLEFLGRGCDRLLLIAPEDDGLLLERCRWVESSSRNLAGPDSRFVALASDKRQAREHLLQAGISVPAALGEIVAGPNAEWVRKPRFGCGSADVCVWPASDLPAGERPRSGESDSAGPLDRQLDEWVVEEFCEGVAVSVAAICRDRYPPYCLPVCRQHIDRMPNGRLVYRGGSLALPDKWNARAQELARRTICALPPTTGYVGVDMVLCEEDAHGDVVIEVNPRLTTSYIGLRERALDNLIFWLLAAPPPCTSEPRFRPGDIVWNVGSELDGTSVSCEVRPPTLEK